MQAAFKIKSQNGRHHAPVCDSMRSETPKMKKALESSSRVLRKPTSAGKAFANRPNATRTQKTASTRLPFCARLFIPTALFRLLQDMRGMEGHKSLVSYRRPSRSMNVQPDRANGEIRSVWDLSVILPPQRRKAHMVQKSEFL